MVCVSCYYLYLRVLFYGSDFSPTHLIFVGTCCCCWSRTLSTKRVHNDQTSANTVCDEKSCKVNNFCNPLNQFFVFFLSNVVPCFPQHNCLMLTYSVVNVHVAVCDVVAFKSTLIVSVCRESLLTFICCDFICGLCSSVNKGGQDAHNIYCLTK